MAKLSEKKAKEHRVWKKETKEESIITGDWKGKLQIEINAISRLIDKNCNCISCSPDTPIKKIFGGHLISVAANSSIRFNLHNIHRQCYSCNGNKGGAQIEYLAGLTRNMARNM